MSWALRWLARRRLRHLHAVGGWLGWAAYALSSRYRQRLRAHATLAGVDAGQRRAAVAEAGRLVAELPRLWLRPLDRPIDDPVGWDGAEQVERWVAAGRGLVLLTPHMGSFELAAQAYAERFGARQPLTVLYRPARQPWLRALQERSRTRAHLAAAPATLAGVRQMVRALRRGHTLGLLPDQVPPDGQGVWVPFFGRDAYTMTLAPRLAQQTGAALGLIWAERLPRGAGFTVRVRALPEPLPPAPAAGAGADAEALWLAAAAAVVNRAMEAVIREHPAQYLWGYHRYKAPRPAATAAAAAAPGVSAAPAVTSPAPAVAPAAPAVAAAAPGMSAAPAVAAAAPDGSAASLARVPGPASIPAPPPRAAVEAPPSTAAIGSPLPRR